MANDTPESDFSIECFQNYSAPEVFVQGLAGMVDQTDVEVIIRAQKTMLQRFEKTTEMLTNCNQLSASRLRAASVEFKKHTQLLLDMKKDLEFIFKKIRAIKTKLRLQRFEKTTEMLTNCNQLSASRLRAASVEFKKHTQLLLDMKKDLEFIFKKIRAIKTKLSSQYPEAYRMAVAEAAITKKPVEEEEEFPTETKIESKMVATVSTETLKPTTSDERKSKKKTDRGTELRSKEESSKSTRKVKSSSSSETESASSGDESSTDTG